MRELHHAGKSILSLAEEFKLHWSTIYRIVNEGNKKGKKKGPRKILVGWLRQKLLQVFHENPTISATKAAKVVGLSVSARTIHQELQNSAFTYVKKKKVQFLTKVHKEKCLDFAHTNVTCPHDQWDRVIFTDEKKWNLCGNDGYILALIEGKNTEQFEWIANRCGGLMVWGVISAFGGICLICPEGKITAETYVNMLEKDFLSVYKEKLLENFIFMHDNTPPHHARFIAKFLERKKIEVLWNGHSLLI